MKIRKIGRRTLITVARGIRTAAVSDKDQILFNEINALFRTVFHIQDLLSDGLIIFLLNDNIFNIDFILDLYIMRFQIFYKGENEALILIVFRKAQYLEVRQSVNVMDIAV